MGTYEFRPLRSDEEACWDDFVRSSPNGNAFLLSATLQMLAARESPAAEVRRVGAFSAGGALEAGWAVLVRRRAGIRYCSSFPLFYAGPLLAPEWNDASRATQRMELLYGLAKEMQQGLDIMDTEAAPSLPDVRGLLYAGCVAEQNYCHVWPACEPEAVYRLPNRTKRQEAAAAAKRHCFAWYPAEPKLLQTFDRLHNQTLTKFKWVASSQWRKTLLQNMETLETMGICRIFGAAPVADPASPCALVTVLFSHEHQTAWLWRLAYQTEDSGLIPALYLRAAETIKREQGSAWSINFGGSPALSLARFKDYLGATPTPHWRIRWQRYSLRMFQWNFMKSLKEFLRRRLTLWHLLRPR